MLNTIIIDDEKDARDTLQNFLVQYCDNIKIVSTADGVQSGVKTILKHQPDLVFLDIQMGDGTGFNLLDQLQPLDFNFVFTTAYDQFALKAFKYSALDYLLKPINPIELKETVNKIGTNHNTNQLEQRLSILEDVFQRKRLQRISAPTLHGLEIINVDSIIYCQADNNYTHFFLQDNKKITVTKTLMEYEDLLPEDQFCRVHQSYIISLNHIAKYVRGDGGVVIMSDDTEIVVSRRKRQFLLDRIS